MPEPGDAIERVTKLRVRCYGARVSVTIVAPWIARFVRKGETLVVGVNGPQGCGKTTLTRKLVRTLADEHSLRAITVSIDDFYLTHAEQRALAASYPHNRYMEHRGYPGTHDVALGARVLAALRHGEDVDVPIYDKPAHAGRGDRSARGQAVRGRQDVVMVEGWMLGFRPVTSLEDPLLGPANEALASYDAWYELIDVMVAIGMRDPMQVVRWRVEAEAAMRATGRPGLSDADAEDYVRRFLPAYATWGRTIAGGRFRGDALLTITLDADRRPT